MMKMKKTLLLLLGLLAQTALMAQSFDYPYVEQFGTPREINLGAPNTAEGTQLVPVGIDLWEGDENNTIHYGAIPPNSSSKPVLVFVHGYASNATVWFQGEDNMYADVYRDGYRSAFISLTPNRHMWTNGNMLANALARVANRYGVAKVVLVGWSKGGVDSDAAVTHFGGSSRVSQVFTLSTPHHGTAIAELANSVLLTFANIIFMQDNDATRCLQRGYMDYFRSVTDTRASVPFTTIGAWGNGPLNRLDLPQEYLHWNGGAKADGGNDGVVPYASSRRPRGTELFGGQRKEYYWWGGWYYTGPSQTELDHYEVTRGGLVWPYIKARLQSGARVADDATETPADYSPNAVVESRMQVLASRRGAQRLFVEEGAGRITLIAAFPESSSLRLRGAAGQEIALQPVSEERLGGQALKQVYTLEGLAPGQYELEGPKGFAAVALFERGASARLTRTDASRVYAPGQQVPFALDFADAQGLPLDAQVTGVALRSSTLEAQPAEGAQAEPFAFQAVSAGRFEAQWQAPREPGVYNITVTVQARGVQRTVVTSLAVAGEPSEQAQEGASLEIVSAYPNPVRGLLRLSVNAQQAGAKLSVFNIYGQQVAQFELPGEGLQEWSWDASQAKPGLYIIQLSDGASKVTKQVVVE
jgi:pimeloyl-ACP methyl ester carboxylesterase